MIVFTEQILYLFLSSLLSILLPAVILFSKRELLRLNKKRELANENSEIYGDLDAYLEDFTQYKKFSIVNYLTEQGIQPLFIICLFNLFNNDNNAEVYLLITLIIIMLLHELFAGEVYSGKTIYRFFILAIWIISFLVFSMKITPQRKDNNTKNEKVVIRNQNEIQNSKK